MLVFDPRYGTITDAQERLLWGIFVYKADDDPTVLVGTSPLVYETYEELDRFLKSESGRMDFEEWRSREHVVVIRPFKACMVRCEQVKPLRAQVRQAKYRAPYWY